MKNKFLQVVNWKQFQHYSKRNPPLIKMYQSLLDTYEFTELSDEAKAHLMQIWLLAAKTGNRIPYDAKWVAKRINAKSRVNLQALIDADWLQVASTTLAGCKQNATTTLAGKTVILWPDNDEAGAKHMQEVETRLQNIASEVLRVNPLQLNIPEKGDVVDYVEVFAGDTTDLQKQAVDYVLGELQPTGPAAELEAALEKFDGNVPRVLAP